MSSLGFVLICIPLLVSIRISVTMILNPSHGAAHGHLIDHCCPSRREKTVLTSPIMNPAVLPDYSRSPHLCLLNEMIAAREVPQRTAIIPVLQRF
jgi:hypothetical protein